MVASNKKTQRESRRNISAKDQDKAPPPAYFLSLRVKNVRCFGEEQFLDLSDGKGHPAKWTVILGDNGTGKTTLLQCLAALEPIKLPFSDLDLVKPRLGPSRRDLKDRRLLFRFPDIDSDLGTLKLNDGLSMTISSDIYYGAKLDETQTGNVCHNYEMWLRPQAGGSSTQQFSRIGGLVCYSYDANRQMGPSLLADRSSDAIGSLFDENVTLINAEEWLLQADYAASKRSSVQLQAELRRDKVKGLLIDLLPDVEDIEFVQPTKGKPGPSVRVKTPYGWVGIKDLSLGYRTLMAWMVDLAHRLFERYPDSPNPTAEPAVVLVDEIDLHLHPKWQRELIGYLSKRFVNTQFIVTAHSPLIVQAADDANIVLLRREGDHVVIEDKREAIRGWRIDQVLTSDLFGLVSARPPRLDELMAKRNKLLSKARFTKADQLKLQELEKQIGPLSMGETPDDIEAMDIIRRAAREINK